MGGVARHHDSRFFSFASFSYFSIVRASTCHRRAVHASAWNECTVTLCLFGLVENLPTESGFSRVHVAYEHLRRLIRLLTSSGSSGH